MRYLTALVALGLVLAVAATAGANTVHAVWDDWTGDGPASGPWDWPADVWDSDLANTAYCTWYGYGPSAYGAERLDSYAGRSGVAEVGGGRGMYDTITFYLPNFPSGPDTRKDFRMAVTWHPESNTQTLGAAVNPALSDYEWFRGVPDADGWVTDVLWGRIIPNPSSEMFGLVFLNADTYAPEQPGYVDRVEFDTKCIPEPLTMAGLVLGLGSLAGYVRRRRVA